MIVRRILLHPIPFPREKYLVKSNTSTTINFVIFDKKFFSVVIMT